MVNFSQAQKDASNRTVAFLREGGVQELLLWAVTGAGKTEVIFSAVHASLQEGKPVLIATPRKDVVLELTPRFERAFPDQSIISLHGESSQKGEIGPLVIATTHQALNFYRCFDLVIVDEVDAFPFHNNPMLQYAVNRARTEDGRLIYLTATPPPDLLKRVRHGLAALLHIPARYHGYPLVVPNLIIDSKLSKKRHQSILPHTILGFIQHLLQTNRQGFIFVPRIELVTELEQIIRKSAVPKLKDKESWVAGTHANDRKRKEKVEAFRQGKIRLLITTTILERGVTIKGSDCLVYMADAEIFDESSLVQIAGRVGRSADDPTGSVIFLAQSPTLAIRRSIKQIKRMNRLARKQGYLREKRQ